MKLRGKRRQWKIKLRRVKVNEINGGGQEEKWDVKQ